MEEHHGYVLKCSVETLMKVLIADRLSKMARDRMTAAEIIVIYEPELTKDSLKQEIFTSKPDILIVRSTRVEAPTLKIGLGSLELVIRAGAGFNTIDVQCATRMGIRVANCPGMNSHAVAEIAFGLMLSLDRQIPDNVFDLRSGRYNKTLYSDARGLYGKTLGIIGLGHIGREMIPRARSFGMDVVAWSRSLTRRKAREIGVRYSNTVLDVAMISDVVSVHVASNTDTHHMIDDHFLSTMKFGAYLINTSRADVIDEIAVAKAVNTRGIKVAIDVFEGEPLGSPGTVDSSLFQIPGVIGTHHIGGATLQAHEAIADETSRIVLQYGMSGEVRNLINKELM